MRPGRRVATAGWLLLIGGLGVFGDDPGLTWIFSCLLAAGGLLLLRPIGSIVLGAFARRPPSSKTKVV